MILDVDHFKAINDTFGHPTGDEVLCGIAAGLNEFFAEDGAIGRIGGDEFAVILKRPMGSEELESRLNEFLQSISGILAGKTTVTCSIGAHAFVGARDEQELMKKADLLLYEAKNSGRARVRMDK